MLNDIILILKISFFDIGKLFVASPLILLITIIGIIKIRSKG